ncbi:MAG TPA: hypothetical protein ENK25_00710 [Bacteroidetes bacterium]|nr:hypothetical protein [Bacteroidota bacterium]
MFLKLILLSIFFIAISFVIMGIRVLFSKNRKFPVTEIGKNPDMRKLGISCPRTLDALSRKGKTDFSGCVNCALYNAGK